MRMDYDKSSDNQDRYSQVKEDYSPSAAAENKSTSSQPCDRAAATSDLADHLEGQPPLWLRILESYLTEAKIKDPNNKQ